MRGPQPRIPPGHYSLRDLIGRYAVTPEQAERNRRALRVPMLPRKATKGIVPLDAAALWQAIGRREFPPPLAGPWGLAWPADLVHRWLRTHRPNGKPPAVGAD